MIGATDIFVSYKAEDRARLQPLVAALEAEGFTVWWDTHIGGGSHWREDIEQHLEAAKCVIVVWTRRSVGPGGDFVRDEATRARKRGAYLPIRFDATDPPLGFGEVQAISLKGWKGDRSDPRFRTITDAVKRRIAGEDIAHVTLPHDRRRISRRTLLVGGVTAVALAIVSGWLLKPKYSENPKRIAVLPFANLSGDPNQEYFSEGIAEELRAALSRIGLEVIGRSSSDAVKDLDTKTAAATLGVANILIGSVRRSPDKIRVDTQLVSGSDGVERWAQSYDRPPGDVIAIQSDIAANVARALSIVLGQAGRAALTLGGTLDSVAHDLVLQSRKEREKADGPAAFRRSLELVNAALNRDPNYADAYVEKANALTLLAGYSPPDPAEIASLHTEAESSARRAIELAPRLGSSHIALAYLDRSRLNFGSSLQQARQALALSPDDPNVLSIAITIILYLGNAQDALHLADRLIELDPLNGFAYRRKAEVLVTLRRYLDSVRAGRKALQLEPDLLTAHMFIGQSLLMLGRPAEALVEFQSLSHDNPYGLAGEGLVAARTGDIAEAERSISGLRALNRVAFSYECAQIYAQERKKDRAFAELENAIAAANSSLIHAKEDAFLDPLRDDPRYATVVKRLNFP